MTSPWKFDPWVPDRANFEGVRLLLVGESHYDQTRNLPSNFTCEIVQRFGVGDEAGSTRLFRNAYAAFTGDFDFAIPAGKSRFWSNVAFCNYFQRVMWPSGEEPSDQDYAESVDPFDAMLAHVKPDCFVVMSTRLWKGMKNKCARLPSIGAVNGVDAFAFDVEGSQTPAIHMSHPSPAAGVFDPRKWHPYLLEFLDYVRLN